MANFLAITPPLGQDTWGLAPVHAQQGFAFPVTTGCTSYEEIGYPPLDAPIRVLILKKYPGTVLPVPGAEDVIPYAKPDPIHIKELWAKYDAVLVDRQLFNHLPTRDLRAFIEREVAEWVAEFDEAQHLAVLAIAERKSITMAIIKEKSKKRARGDALEDDAATETKESRVTKVAKKESPTTTATRRTRSMKEVYDNVWPTDVIAEQGSPAYVMALTYLKAYAHSDEAYAHRIREIFAKQGEENITQRCARFFAWGLKQALRTPKAVSTVNATEPAAAHPAQLITTSTTAAIDVASEDEDEENSDYEEIKLDDEDSDSDDEIINFQPLDKKPSFRFEPSPLSERLGSFVAELKGANEKLAAEGGPNLSIELNDSDDGEHVEMNLGLGVLEEVCEDDKEIIISKV